MPELDISELYLGSDKNPLNLSYWELQLYAEFVDLMLSEAETMVYILGVQQGWRVRGKIDEISSDETISILKKMHSDYIL